MPALPADQLPAPGPLRVVLAEDSVLFREGMARLLREQGFEVVAQTDNAEELLRRTGSLLPDVAVVDIRMPPSFTDEGLRAANTIGERFPRMGVLVLSQYVESTAAVRLLEHATGGRGYLLKDRISDLGAFGDAVRRVAAGDSVIDPTVVDALVGRRSDRRLAALTARELEVLRLMAEGRSNAGICEQLFLSPRTVETHVRSIFHKLTLEDVQEDNRRVLAVLAFLRT